MHLLFLTFLHLGRVYVTGSASYLWVESDVCHPQAWHLNPSHTSPAPSVFQVTCYNMETPWVPKSPPEEEPSNPHQPDIRFYVLISWKLISWKSGCRNSSISSLLGKKMDKDSAPQGRLLLLSLLHMRITRTNTECIPQYHTCKTLLMLSFVAGLFSFPLHIRRIWVSGWWTDLPSYLLLVGRGTTALKHKLWVTALHCLFTAFGFSTSHLRGHCTLGLTLLWVMVISSRETQDILISEDGRSRDASAENETVSHYDCMFREVLPLQNP